MPSCMKKNFWRNFFKKLKASNNRLKPPINIIEPIKLIFCRHRVTLRRRLMLLFAPYQQRTQPKNHSKLYTRHRSTAEPKILKTKWNKPPDSSTLCHHTIMTKWCRALNLWWWYIISLQLNFWHKHERKTQTSSASVPYRPASLKRHQRKTVRPLRFLKHPNPRKFARKQSKGR